MSIDDDAKILWKLNTTELICLGHVQGLGILKRNLPRETLLAIVGNYIEPLPEHFAQSNYTRQKLEEYIQLNYMKVRNQLPGCTGRCLTYHCTEGRHAGCYSPNAMDIHE